MADWREKAKAAAKRSKAESNKLPEGPKKRRRWTDDARDFEKRDVRKNGPPVRLWDEYDDDENYDDEMRLQGD